MIKRHERRFTVDIRGKIKSGMFDEAKNIPRALPYFNVDDFRELGLSYGTQPTELIVFMPSNRIEDAFDDSYTLYAGGRESATLVRKCDGESCIHRISEQVGETTYGAGEISECVCHDLPERIMKGDKEVLNPQRCRYVMYLKAYIGLPPTYAPDNTACYLFESHSENSGIAIKSELEKIHILNNGILWKIPFRLSVRMVGKSDNAKMKFPIWHLQAIGLLSQWNHDRALGEGVSEATLRLIKARLIDEMVAELEEIEKRPTTDRLDQWYAGRHQDVEGLVDEEKNLIRAKFKTINEAIKKAQQS